MCGRFARWTPRQEFAALAGLRVGELPVGETNPSWNITPGRACTVVRHELDREPGIDQLIWGFIPHKTGGYPARRPINARLETADQLWSFRRCFRFRRCLVAADGWYEWAKPDRGAKQPYFHHLGRPFFFGGLWDEWRAPDGALHPTFAILTQPALPAISTIHDRMPVIVREDGYADWLDKGVTEAAAVRDLCTPPNEVIAYRVSIAVNRPETDEPALIEAV